MSFTDEEMSIFLQKVSETAAKATLQALEDKKKADVKAVSDRKLHNTRMLLNKYRLLNEHIDNATFKKSQIETAEAIDWINEMYDPNNKADAIVESIKNSALKTRIMVAHIQKMLRIYEIYCQSDKSPKMMRKYEAFYGRYISEKRVRYEKVAENWNVDVRTIQTDVKEAVKEFSSLLFGLDWMDKTI